MRSRAVEPEHAVLELDRLPVGQARDRRPPALAVVGVHERLPQAVVLGAAGERPAGQRVAVGAAVDGPVAAVRLDPQRVEVIVHRLDDARQRRMRLGELGAHAPPLGHVGHDAADLDGAVGAAAGRGAVVDPARDPVRADQAVLDVALLAGGERGVERVVCGAVVRVQRGVPVLHLGVGLGAAEQAVGAGTLEELLEAPVGERLRHVDVLADDVEQASEAVARPRPAARRPPRAR